MGRSLRPVCLAAVLSAALCGCGQPSTPPSPASGDRMPVCVSILPEAGLVNRIGGAHVAVDVLVQPGQSMETYEVSPKQVERLAQARLYFRIGVPFENRLMPKIERMMPDLKVIDARDGVQLRRMTEPHEDHEHPLPESGETGLDPHIWLGPAQLGIMARTIARALSEADPSHAAEYSANLNGFLKDLEAVNARVAEVLAPLKGRSFYVFHPAFGYFGDAYGLTQVAAEIEGKTPTPRQLEQLITRAKADNVKIVFVQPQFDPKAAEALAQAIGGAVVPMDPLAEDVLANLEDMATKIEQALNLKTEIASRVVAGSASYRSLCRFGMTHYTKNKPSLRAKRSNLPPGTGLPQRGDCFASLAMTACLTALPGLKP